MGVSITRTSLNREQCPPFLMLESTCGRQTSSGSLGRDSIDSGVRCRDQNSDEGENQIVVVALTPSGNPC